MAETTRLQRVEQVARDLEARFGAQVLYRLMQARPRVGERVLASGSLALDVASGVGGFPRGHLAALVGPESSGKTTLAYHLLASAQRGGGLAALVDGEQSATPEVLRACGVDVDDLILATPSDTLEALAMADLLGRCHALDGLVVAGLERVAPRSLYQLQAGLRGGPTALLFVLPDRGARGELPGPYSLVVKLAPLRPLYGPGGEVDGFQARARVSRSRLGKPGAEARLWMRLGGGLDRAAESLDRGLELGLIRQVGGVLAWRETPLGRNRHQAQRLLARDAELLGWLTAELERRSQDATTELSA